MAVVISESLREEIIGEADKALPQTLATVAAAHLNQIAYAVQRGAASLTAPEDMVRAVIDRVAGMMGAEAGTLRNPFATAVIYAQQEPVFRAALDNYNAAYLQRRVQPL